MSPRRRTWQLPLCWAIALCLTTGVPQVSSAQEAVFIIRHAERADGEDPPITPAGRDRSVRWAEMLSGAGIAHVYTSTARRTAETGAIIAEALGVESEALPPNDIAPLLDLMSFDFEDERVLVVGHTETIPNILREFGAFEQIELSRDDYGRMFVVHPGDDEPLILELQMP